MNLLILCGITNAGKSQTIRFSVRHLNQTDNIVFKFEHNQNPPKRLLVSNIPVYIYLCSPQELTYCEDTEECRNLFKNRITHKEPNALVVLAFNFEDVYRKNVDVCLDEIVKQKMKKSTYFVLLDAPIVSSTSNDQARDMFNDLKTNGYNCLGQIQKAENNRKQRGKEFSKYIKQKLM